MFRLDKLQACNTTGPRKMSSAVLCRVAVEPTALGDTDSPTRDELGRIRDPQRVRRTPR